LNVVRLIEQHGPGVTLQDAVAGINADCPNWEARGVMERCDIYFPGLGELLQ
jgi:hypothetical protein